MTPSIEIKDKGGITSNWRVCEEDAVWFDCAECGGEHLIGPDEEAEDGVGVVECKGVEYRFVWRIDYRRIG